MKQTGHYGVSLFLYSPFAFVLLSRGDVGLAVVGGALAIALAMVPDCDYYVPFVDHRGVTHTVAFALVVGVVVGFSGAIVGARIDAASARTFGVFAFGVATLTVVSHLLADVLTPMGVRPFWPLSRRHFTLDVVPARNWVANQLLFALGVVAVGVVVLATRSV